MFAILLVTFPFFALVLCGYLAARRAYLPLEAIPGLNTFVLYFALPCMLYRFVSTTPVAELLDPGLIAVYSLCALIMVGLTIGLTLGSSIHWNDAAFGALVAAFPNSGFMGVPLLVTLLGPRAAGPAIVTIMIDMLLTTSLCIALSRLDSSASHSVAVAVRKALRGVAVNPLPWAILFGAIASASGLVLPGALMQTVGLLADAASPVALFTIGAVLARSQVQALQPSPLSQTLPVALLKLLLHPLLVLLVGAAAILLGLPLSKFALSVIVLVAALPSASNVSLLAERYGADNGRVARIILFSTALSFLSFSAAVSVLR